MLAIEALEALGPDGVAELLRLRPDLARPRTTSVEELARRAVSPPSLALALRLFDLPTLQVAEALAAVERSGGRASLDGLLGLVAGDGTTPARAALDRALDELRCFLFLQPRAEPRLLPEISRAWPEPLGLGPPAARLFADLPVAAIRQGLYTLGIQTRETRKADLVATLASSLADADRVQKVLEQAPPAVAERIRQAAFGRPLSRSYLVGSYSVPRYRTAGATNDPALWAVDHLLAVHTYDEVVLPAEVTLALRGPDWHVPFAHAEPALLWTARSEQAQHRGAAAAAGQSVRTVTAVLESLGRRTLQQLTTGAVGVRELRRLAKEQGVSVPEIRLALALAHQAGLAEPAAFGVSPTADAEAFLRRSPAERAVQLMSAWLEVAHLPMLGDDGWFPQPSQRLLDVKHTVLITLGWRRGQAPDLAGLNHWLSWRHPMVFTGRLSTFSSGNGEGAPEFVSTVLAEGAWLGLVTDGALTAVGRQVIEGDLDVARSALDRDLGRATTTARFQADLTAVVMGHPAAELSATLDELAVREARSVATTWRFGPASIRQALDRGWTGAKIRDRLAAIAEEPLPQPLTYLIDDVARRHGHLRGGAAACYLRGEDLALLREVAADRRLTKLGLRLVADAVLVGDRPLAETLAELRKAGYAPIEEDHSGAQVIRRPTPLDEIRPRPKGGRRPRR